ncbi:aminomethyl-transferring glycine dehydrogenase [Aliidiomarina quisquiliarum]|uniref:aminomethyl-transferring glycine dehydrogenase n=1 Tax=Aliidiomarina quisquiliarum TaxID=2938947 RepID=UPI00208E19D8|nr:aminomethyl-transferring glycine dehydrogenase [Aliidiomarina quisquiliarum]MCO4322722.1 aminomethyl-transferring glycine dehydrogenase [Aliidiomarina quisquiliarum]
MSSKSLYELEQHDDFIQRHIGPDANEQKEMLEFVGASSLADMTAQTVPSAILREPFLSVGEPMTERDALAKLKAIAKKNQVFTSYIGAGYYDTLVPNVIVRNVLENPGWYTAYTPYQPEIAQGRLEAILNFQQLTIDLTGLEMASASLLDEATAAAEAMAVAQRVSKSKSNSFFVADNVFPQTVDVVKARAEMFGFDIIMGPWQEAGNHNVFGALFQSPSNNGEVLDLTDVIAAVQAQKGLVGVATDLMSLVHCKTPGEMGADMVFGSAQRFGVPMGYGGPHAAFFATREKFKRALPGRIIGVSRDTRGKAAMRLAMQTREQHIRREKATSNICTAQVLLANMASFYAVYHGPEGLKTIAARIHRMTSMMAAALREKGMAPVNTTWFDTLAFKVEDSAREAIIARSKAAELNLRIDTASQLSLSFDEAKSRADFELLLNVIFGEGHGLTVEGLDTAAQANTGVPAELLRNTPFLTHEVFNTYHSETEMLRYIRKLEGRDLALNHSMISLGSCTMKLNATAEMIPITWPEFGQLHPFCPLDQAQGYAEMLSTLSTWLVDITGYDAMSLQPNSGAQGEYAGLLAIDRYHNSRGEGHRKICLIPESAHGTNPASAQMAGMKVVVVACDEKGNIDLDDLREKAASVADQLSCAMVTYPSTHGVYEENIVEVCEIIHEFGGQVYMDGANMNAQVGVTSPGFIGSDVSHLNLHKTFCIPHGGGGPGMGPIGVKSHLEPFLPGHVSIDAAGLVKGNGAVSAAPYGSASILPIPWMYIAMMGSRGLREATEVAILNANYIAKRLEGHFPVLYSGRNGRVAHECIIDLRPLKETTGIAEIDVAKRLQDYGFHSPTMSFPVAGTLMIEPTESESKAEMDRFIDAMISIRKEIEKVANGEWAADNNPLVHAPHTLADIVDENWNRPYSREEAAYPAPWLPGHKFWPSVNRIDDVYGDRNLVCACPPMSEYM